jgi:hypothetical protein
MRNFLLAVAAAAIALPAQPLANDSFQILTSPTGLTSLKRVHDAYDTDYIAGGRALGNVLVRYKLPAETSWQTALYPTGRSQSGQSVSYRIGRAIPTIATSSKTSAPYRRMPLGALNDQIEPASSSDETVLLPVDRPQRNARMGSVRFLEAGERLRSSGLLVPAQGGLGIKRMQFTAGSVVRRPSR